MKFAPSNRYLPLLLLAGMISFSGCGDGRFVYAPVSGMVTLDGKPLALAKVIFIPQPDGINDGLTGKMSYCVTDDTGHFDLKTINGDPGAKVGTNSVAILGELRDENEPMIIKRPEYLPARYYEGKTLTFDVPRGGTTEANFDLTSDK